MSDIKLTQYSHGAGCGCKIAPKVLDAILEGSRDAMVCPELLVGNGSNDDAAAYDLGNGTSMLSTTDFFMPIVDDPFTFGRIAATNAISDIYAMGGRPLMALSIFGWPVNLLSSDVAKAVIEGGRFTCKEAGIPLAGGHSIDAPEPIFGLAVSGIVENRNLKRNNTAQSDALLFLTKPLGVGILTTAQKQGKITPAELQVAIDAMCTLNRAGFEIAQIEGVSAMTDVTGFGLMGHLSEICLGSGVGALIYADAVPLLEGAAHYQALGCVPGGTRRNFESYKAHLGPLSAAQQDLFCDAQTSGGLLCVVARESVAAFLEVTRRYGLELEPIGETTSPKMPLIEVI